MTENNIENNEQLPPASRLATSDDNAVIVENPTIAEDAKVEEQVVVEEEPKDEVIMTPSPVSNSNEEPAATAMGNSVPSGAFSTEVPKKTTKKAAVKSEKKTDMSQVVIFAEKNLYFPGTGKITFGFNIVSEKDSKVYLKHKSVREATPEELARKYAK